MGIHWLPALNNQGTTTEGQTDRHIDRQTDRQMDRQKELELWIHIGPEHSTIKVLRKDGQTDRRTDMYTGIQTGRQTDRYTVCHKLELWVN